MKSMKKWVTNTSTFEAEAITEPSPIEKLLTTGLPMVL